MKSESLASDPGSIALAGSQLARRDTTAGALIEASIARTDAVESRVQAW